MKNTNETKPKRRVLVAKLFTLLALVTVAYFLSSGPVLSIAARVHCYGTPSYTFLRTLYSPVFALAKSSDVGTRYYESYARMWCRLILPAGSPGTEVPAIVAFRYHPTPETQAEFDRQERISELDSLESSAILVFWIAGMVLFVKSIWKSKPKVQQDLSDEQVTA